MNLDLGVLRQEQKVFSYPVVQIQFQAGRNLVLFQMFVLRSQKHYPHSLCQNASKNLSYLCLISFILLLLLFQFSAFIFYFRKNRQN